MSVGWWSCERSGEWMRFVGEARQVKEESICAAYMFCENLRLRSSSTRTYSTDLYCHCHGKLEPLGGLVREVRKVAVPTRMRGENSPNIRGHGASEQALCHFRRPLMIARPEQACCKHCGMLGPVAESKPHRFQKQLMRHCHLRAVPLEKPRHPARREEQTAFHTT